MANVTALRLLLLRNEFDPNETHGPDQSTALHVAATVGFLTGIDQLLQHPEVNINVTDALGRTPVHRAILVNDVDCLKLLLKNGARIDVPDKNGRLPIHLAALYRRTDCVTVLLAHHRNADHLPHILETKTLSDRRTVVAECIVGGSAVILRRLLAEVTAKSARWVGLAVAWNRIECLHALIEAGLDVNRSLVDDDPSDTPIYRAVQQRKIDVVRCLRAAHADPCLQDGSNPSLLYAANHGFVDMIKLLLTPNTSSDCIRQAYLLMDSLGQGDQLLYIIKSSH
ncbi:ankyrin repeat-containing domain protein [Dichotomocladium elegans]|nr:ankyrin repeat-containing domain protein [Dichotomocladium elegans]